MKFTELLNEKALEKDYPKLEKKARKALDVMNTNIDIILDIMKDVDDKKAYKKFNIDIGNAWELANDFIDKEFGK